MIRRNGHRPTIALWMLVAIADAALLVAAAGSLAVVLAVAAAALLCVGVAGVWILQRRTPPRRESALRRRA
jgi:amino acid transporter